MTFTEKGGSHGKAHQEGRQGWHQEGLLICLGIVVALLVMGCHDPAAPSCGNVPPTWITPDSVLITICAVGPIR